MNPNFIQNNSPFSLSVIVPNFNDAKYLAQCIGSVVTQDVLPDEFIILDDASTDNSVEVIEKAITGHSFARIEHNPVNLGFGGVPNSSKGLLIAKSKYIYLLGANDFILPGFFRKLKEALERFPEAGVFSAMVWLINEEGRYLNLHRSSVLSLKEKFLSAKRCREIMIKNGSWLTGQTLVYRREALIEAGGFRQTLGGLCDFLAAQVVVSRYGAVFLPDPLGVMRIHTGAFLVKTLADDLRLEEIIDEIDRSGRSVQPNLFTTEMMKKTRLRLYFASLRLSQGATLSHIQKKIGKSRRYLLKIVCTLPSQLQTVGFFFIMRPFDVFSSFWYRALGSSLIIFKERLGGRVPPRN